MEATIHTRKLGGPHAGRTVLITEPHIAQLPNGTPVVRAMPVLVELRMRPAHSAPEGTRIKASLTMDTPDGPMPLPVAQATVLPIAIPALTVESRLEMN